MMARLRRLFPRPASPLVGHLGEPPDETASADSQRLQAFGHFVGGVAHDLNNLLTAVLGGVDAIAERGGLDGETLDDLATMRASAGRGAALVRHLLAFGREQASPPRALAMNGVIAELAGVLRHMLGGKVRLELALEQPGRMVLADPTALDRVLVNLAVNAGNAMPDGGTLTLRSGHMGRYVMLEVQDTGGGIAPEVLPHIFDPHFTTRQDRGGSGLGLSTVHRLALQAGGYVAAESQPGQGTRMRVYLPQRGETAPQLPAITHVPAGTPGPRGLVLLVEDEDTIRRVAERALLRQGWQVLSAETGEVALDLLAQTPMAALAAVVTDLLLPGMDGVALVKAVRELLAAPRLPAIIVSGYAAESSRRGIATEAATWFLAKPYEIKQLTAKLAEIASLPKPIDCVLVSD